MKETGLAQAGQSGSSASIEYTPVGQENQTGRYFNRVYFLLYDMSHKKSYPIEKDFMEVLRFIHLYHLTYF